MAQPGTVRAKVKFVFGQTVTKQQEAVHISLKADGTDSILRVKELISVLLSTGLSHA